ncbi:MAG: 2-hydroxyacyl-CoA dehydratase [Dehalococcoidia bacterium]|nr:MAG: 2-hydroxyacyl-CoA dehydratase [Dehalococcoidia bacterium]
MEAKQEAERLVKARDIYENRDRRARELKAEGQKVIGYLCAYVPVEMITALDMVPYRVLGAPREPITEAAAHLQTVLCPFVRSCFDQSLKGKYDFLDGFVSVHSCDTVYSAVQFWTYYVKTPYDHFIDMPHTTHKASIEFFKNELDLFWKTLEEFAGKEISPQSLKDAIAAHNEQRALVRELYDLRKADPPLISGTETLQILIGLMSIPVTEGNALLRESIKEVKSRQDGPKKQPFRLLVWGSPLDDVTLIEMIEGCGANVVIDDICTGTRFYWPNVEVSSDLVGALAQRYLDEVRCPRTFRETGPNYWADLENRFAYVKDFAKDWNVNGVILQSMKYCDTHGYEVPGLKDYLRRIGLPAFYLEHEYTMVALAPLRTRVEAFLETMA